MVPTLACGRRAAGDVSFPNLDPAVWRRESRVPQVSRTGLEYAIETYTRIGAGAP